MLNDPTNQIPGSSSNPGSSTQPAFNQMPYYPNPNYQPQFTNQEELLMFQQFKMQQMHQQQPQQLPNQFTTSQPHSEQQSHHLEVEDTEDEDEPVPTPTSKPSRGVRLKSKAKKNKEKEPPLEKQKRIRNAWTQDEELLLAECFIQVSEDPKTGCDQKRDTFWYKIQNVYNTEAKKKGFTERTKNMLTGKWTPMNASVLKFNQLVQETAVHSGENDDDHMSRVHTLYDATVGGEFKHRSAWLFLKGKHKWTNPDSTLQRRNRLLGTDEEPEHFGDDDLPRPPGLQRLAKSQRTGSNSTASSGSNPAAYQEFMAEQYELDRKAKMTVLERESEDRRRLIQSQRIAEDMRVLQIDTRGMDAADAAIINAQKARIRAAYPPPPN
ncbi:hypothetical protein Tco_1273856 [Tanacetum coccineum]|uniref:No apical meristem-associated C-terminal domain-containing protein n=1 Tax=Tanacetum coccineum TaxID=301880 RepID=A0ABQ5EZK8_9ASTR